MWYIYYHGDSWESGWTVSSREEAEEYCERFPGYRYVYVG